MSYSGNGTFVINSAGQPVVTNTTISSTAFNALTADLATGLSTALTKDGQTTATANLPMGTKKLTGLGVGTANTDSITLGQSQAGGALFLTAAGTVDVITATGAPTITAYATGNSYYFTATGANTTNVTLNVDSLGAKAVTKNGSTALVAGDIPSGAEAHVVYDGTRFQLINPASVTTWSYRNLIINGEFKVSQRGGTTSVTADATGCAVDQIVPSNVGGPGVYSVIQDTTVPNASFVNSLKIQCTTIDATIAAGDYYRFSQRIEGLRCSRISFGTANAKTVTISFWIHITNGGSSITFPAQFSGALTNSASDRSYPFAFTVTAASTWQYVTVTIAGDTTGTWLQTSGIGLIVWFSLATGSSRQQASGAWYAGTTTAATGDANTFMANTGNILRMTGLQLEVGSIATPFEYRSYGEELFLCQRYLWRWTSTIANEKICTAAMIATTDSRGELQYPVPMRAAPTLSVSAAADFDSVNATGGTQACSAIVGNVIGPNGCELLATVAATTAGQGSIVAFDGTTGRWLQFSAEL